MMQVSEQSPFDQIPSNSELLHRYVVRQDQAAFATLVERFGPMVLGISRRLLIDFEDADDAVQLAFAELARRAGTIANPNGLASWLHVVTVHIALRMRRRRPGHASLASDPIDPRLSLDDVARRSDFEILSEELERLPADWREPLVLRYFSGLSNEETASQLGTTVAAVEGKLKRGKKSLRIRLLRRGVSVASVLAAVAPARFADAAATEPLDHEFWSCCHDAAQDVATTPSDLTCLPPLEPTTMVTPIITFKAASAIGVAAVLIASVSGPGHDSTQGSSVAPVSTIAAADETGEEGSFAATVIEAGPETADPARETFPIQEQPSPVTPYAGEGISNGRNPSFGVGTTQSRGAGVQATPTTSNTFEDASSEDDPFASDTGNEEQPVSVDPFGGSSTPNANGSTRPDSNLVRRPWPSNPPVSETLEKPVNVTFTDETVEDAIQFLSEAHHFEFRIDHASLEEIGLSEDAPINLTTDRMPIREILTVLLAEQLRDLDYVIRENAIVITSADAAASVTSTRRYRVPASVNADDLAVALTEHVRSSRRGPIEWQSDGGAGVVSVLPMGRPSTNTLLITHSDRGHEAIEAFLQLLSDDESQAATPPEPEAEVTGVEFEDYGMADMGMELDMGMGMESSPAVETTLVAYDVAKVSRLLYAPNKSPNGGAGSGYPGGGYAGGGGGFGNSAIRLITLDELSLLSKQKIRTELTVQRGSQLLVRTDAANHGRISKAIDEVVKLLSDVGPPEIEGATTIEATEPTGLQDYGADYGSEYDFGGGYIAPSGGFDDEPLSE